jgi:hypothetical protein
MASEADYGMSTVLEEARAASTVRFLVPGGQEFKTEY